MSLINICTKLYRYDIEEPPKNWDDNFKNPEYQTGSEHKNKANLYFFIDTKETAKKLVENVKIKQFNQYYISSCETMYMLKIIDFDGLNIYGMLDVLYHLKINVMTDDFKTYIDNSQLETFKKFQDPYDTIKNIDNKINKSSQDYLLKIEAFSKLKLNDSWKLEEDNSGVFGQRLTDFDNGIEFKKLVGALNKKIDGYRWKENKDNDGFTYCLFNSKKLSPPKSEVFQMV
ncbi:hypothetical protein AD998_11320 [bacterium 336/3]|nr:hypothetical protein AD998_11320 [bacterium 336/3]